MKKILLTITILFTAIIAFAYAYNTRLVISGATSNNIKVLVDGYNVGNKYRNGNTFFIDDISTANHRIQIIKLSTNIFGANTDKVIYDQNLYLKTNYQTNLTLTPFGTVDINEVPIYNNSGGWNGSNDNNYPNNSPDWNGNNGNNNQPQCGHGNNGRGNRYGHRKHHKRKKYDRNNDWDD